MGEYIPRFKSREEERRFWTRTGLDALASDQYEEVKVERPGRRLSTTFAVRLDQPTVAHIRQLARLHGMGPTQLVRAWIMERLRIEEALTEPSTDLPVEIELAVRRRVAEEAFATALKAAKKALREVLEGFADREAKAERQGKRATK